jgi:RNA polymerase sigma-70 factor (ECF subfamily)
MQGDELRTADLALAAACAAGDVAAIELVEQRYFADLDRALARFEGGAPLVEEVKQRLRHKLFVGDGEGPKISTYSGRGDLGRWIRVAATREAIGLVRKAKKEIPMEEVALARALAGGSGDLELDYLKGLYRSQFKAAFEEALAALEPKERTVLKYHVLDGLNIDQIGAVYGVHRATVARWISSVRDTLLGRTRKILMDKIAVDRAEFDSIMRLIQSQLDVSLSRLLRDGAAQKK